MKYLLISEAQVRNISMETKNDNMKRENSALRTPQKKGMRPKALIVIYSRLPQGSAVKQAGHREMALLTE